MNNDFESLSKSIEAFVENYAKAIAKDLKNIYSYVTVDNVDNMDNPIVIKNDNIGGDIMKSNFENWINSIKDDIDNNTCYSRNSKIESYLFFIQKQIAISNEIKLKELELQYNYLLNANKKVYPRNDIEIT